MTTENAAQRSASATDTQIATLTSAQKQAWNEGKELTPPTEESATSDTPKVETSATDPEKGASVETVPESDPDKPQERKGHSGTPEPKRVQQLLEERRKDRERIAELERKLSAPVPPKQEPAPAPIVTNEAPKKPVKPKEADYATFEAFEAAKEQHEVAKDAYFEQLADYKAEQRVLKYQMDQDLAARQRTFQETVAGYKERYKDFEQVFAPAATAIVGDEQVPMMVKEFLNSMPAVGDVVYDLGADSEKLEKFITQAKSDPYGAIRFLTTLESEVSAKLATPPGKKDTPAPPETRAPKPVSEVGGRGTAPEDGLVSSAQANDFRGFKREANRRAIAGMK